MKSEIYEIMNMPCESCYVYLTLNVGVRLGDDPEEVTDEGVLVIESKSYFEKFEINMSTEAEGVLHPNEYEQLDAALSGRDPIHAALDVFPGEIAIFEIEQKNRPEKTGFHWYLNLDDVTADFADGWYGVAQGMYQTHVRDVYVGENLAFSLERTRANEDVLRSQWPPPDAFWLSSRSEIEYRHIFAGPSIALALVHLANGVRVDDNDRVVAVFEGVLSLEIDLTRCPSALVSYGSLRWAKELWEWVNVDGYFARMECARRALTLSGGDTFEHVIGNLGAILKTAKYLFEISQRDLVITSLQARRDARKMAVDYVIRSGSIASEGVGRTIVTVFVVVGGLVGTLAGNLGGQLSYLQSAIFFGAAMLFSFFAWLVSLLVYLPKTDNMREVVKKDLMATDPVVTQEDVGDLLNLSLIKQTESKVERARIIVDFCWGIIGLVSAVLLIVYIVCAASQPTAGA